MTLTILMLVAGLIVTGLVCIPSGLEFWRKGDGYAVNVTVLAAAGLLTPFIGFAAMAYETHKERERIEASAALGHELDMLEANVEQEAASNSADKP